MTVLSSISSPMSFSVFCYTSTSLRSGSALSRSTCCSFLRLFCDSQRSLRFPRTPRHAPCEPDTIIRSTSAPAVVYAQPLLARSPTRSAQSDEGRQHNCDLPLESKHDNRRDHNQRAIVALTRDRSLINEKLDVDFAAVQDVSTVQDIIEHATSIRPRAPRLYTLTFDY